MNSSNYNKGVALLETYSDRAEVTGRYPFLTQRPVHTCVVLYYHDLIHIMRADDEETLWELGWRVYPHFLENKLIEIWKFDGQHKQLYRGIRNSR